MTSTIFQFGKSKPTIVAVVNSSDIITYINNIYKTCEHKYDVQYNKETDIITVKMHIETTNTTNGYIWNSIVTELNEVNITYLVINDILLTTTDTYVNIKKELKYMSSILSTSVLINLANTYKNNDQDRAEVYYSLAYDKNDHTIGCHAAYLAGNMFELSDPQKAFEWYKKASVKYYLYATWKLAMTYMKQKEYGDAITYYQLALQQTCNINLTISVLKYYKLTFDENIDIISCYKAIYEILKIRPDITLQLLRNDEIRKYVDFTNTLTK